jgi:predicted permease
MPRHPPHSDHDFNEEIQAHLQIEADRLVGEGMTREQALGAARRAFGNVTRTRERFYEAGRARWLDRLSRDLVQAFRQIRRTPVSSATIVLSLALGIGVNTAIFSLADQVLLRALPVERPEQLVLLDWNGEFVGGGRGMGSLLPHPFFRDLRQQNDVFEHLFARHPTDVQLSAGGAAEPVVAEIVSGSYFPALGVRPALGRLFTERDDVQLDGHPLVVLSHDYWRTRLNADPQVVGRRILVNNFPMTVVGVTESRFHGVDWATAPAVWIPLMMKRPATPGWDGLFDRRERWLHVFGRLKPGLTARDAQVRLQPWFKAYLRDDTRREGWPQVTDAQMHRYLASSLDVLPAANGRSPWVRIVKPAMFVLLAATGLVLVLACLNVASLSLARTLARRRTIALRAALGASRARLVIEQLLESALLAAGGCVVGVLLAPQISLALLSFLPEGIEVAVRAELDWRVLSFAIAIAALATLFAGAAPAIYAASTSAMDAIKEQSASVAGGLVFRKTLVVVQVALALVLLIGAGLFTRTLATLRAQGPGYSTSNLLTFKIDPMGAGHGVSEAKPLIRRVLASIQALPDVQSAGVGRWGMLTPGGWGNPLTVEAGRRFVTDNTSMNAVSPGFFATLGAPVVRGRDFSDRDAVDTSDWRLRSAIVNEEFVRRYLSDRDPLGARVGMGQRPDTVTEMAVVGVVRTFHSQGLRDPEPQIFFPLWERSVEEGTFYVRARRSTAATMRSVRASIGRIDPQLSILSLRTIDDQLDRLLIVERVLAVLAGAFAAAATLLAMIGLYGVLSFSAARRTKEMGIRLALGAPRWQPGALIVREAAWLTLAGLAIALPMAWALGRLVQSLLFGVSPMDATTIGAAAAAIAVVCLLASAAPARKSWTVNPLDALRSE